MIEVNSSQKCPFAKHVCALPCIYEYIKRHITAARYICLLDPFVNNNVHIECKLDVNKV